MDHITLRARTPTPPQHEVYPMPAPITSEWLKRALAQAPEEMARWPAWLRGASQEPPSELKQASSNANDPRNVKESDMYALDAKTEAQLGNSFTYHPPKADQLPRYELLRDEARKLALQIMVNCPMSRERSLAMTKLEEAIMWANKAIACNE